MKGQGVGGGDHDLSLLPRIWRRNLCLGAVGPDVGPALGTEPRAVGEPARTHIRSPELPTGPPDAVGIEVPIDLRLGRLWLVLVGVEDEAPHPPPHVPLRLERG